MLQKNTILYLLLSFISIMQMSFAQTTAIPDNNFEQRLIDLGLDDVIDGQVLTANINTVTNLNINDIAITNLSGIEDFDALENLFARNTNIVNLDLSSNSNLEFLSINTTSNSYQSIDVSNTNVSTMLLITPNLLIINVANTINLSSLNVSNTNISTLDVSASSNLLSLNVSNTNISTLDVSSNINLSSLNVSNTGISTLDVSSNANLSTLDVSNTNLSTLNVSNTPISTLDVSNTNLSTLDASSISTLTTLNIDGLNLTELEVDNTNISILDVSAHTNLTKLQVNSNTSITELNMQNGFNSNLGSSDFLSFGTPNLSCIQVDDVAYANATWNNVDSANSFSTDCGFTLGINNNEFDADISIYPNPVSDVLNVSASISINSLKIYNLNGNLIIESKNSSINTSYLSSGIYILQIETEKGIENRKVIKK